VNILLTGSDGFIGSHLFYNLKEEHNVIGFDTKHGDDVLTSDFPTDIDYGSGDYQTRYVNTDDYRAQEFPNGTSTTINTYYLNINKS